MNGQQGGKRTGAGRKPYPDPARKRVQRSVFLAPETDAAIRAEQGPRDSYGQVVDRLVARARHAYGRCPDCGGQVAWHENIGMGAYFSCEACDYMDDAPTYMDWVQQHAHIEPE